MYFFFFISFNIIILCLSFLSPPPILSPHLCPFCFSHFPLSLSILAPCHVLLSLSSPVSPLTIHTSYHLLPAPLLVLLLWSLLCAPRPYAPSPLLPWSLSCFLSPFRLPSLALVSCPHVHDCHYLSHPILISLL